MCVCVWYVCVSVCVRVCVCFACVCACRKSSGMPVAAAVVVVVVACGERCVDADGDVMWTIGLKSRLPASWIPCLPTVPSFAPSYMPSLTHRALQHR